MAKKEIFDFIRVIPRESGFLDRKQGSRGEIFFDRNSNTLRLYDGLTTGGISLAKTDLSNVSNASFLAKSVAAGVSGGGAGGNSFSSVAVSGQSTVIADTSSDVLNLVAGTNVTITTNAANDSITISATGAGGASNSFSTITVPDQNSIFAESSTDVLNIVGGENISVTTSGKTLTISSEINLNVTADDSTVRTLSNGQTIKFVGAGSVTTSSDVDGNITITGSLASTSFSGLTDSSTASLTVDEIYLPAITQLAVTNSGSSAYLFDQYNGNNPTLYAISGTTISFKLLAGGHPFLIQDGTGTNYNTGLIHVSSTGTVSTGASAQGKDSGTLYWKIPLGATGNYRYQCSVHGSMVGTITIKNFISI